MRLPGQLCDVGTFKPVFLSARRKKSFHRVRRRILTTTGSSWLFLTLPHLVHFVQFDFVKSRSQNLALHERWRGPGGNTVISFPSDALPGVPDESYFLTQKKKIISYFWVKTRGCLPPWLPQVQRKCET